MPMADIKDTFKPSVCTVTFIESLNVLSEQCGEEQLVDLLCDLLGVDDEAREKIKAGECDELTKNGCTPCICGSSRALKAYVVCKVLERIRRGEQLYDALEREWVEVNTECGEAGVRED